MNLEFSSKVKEALDNGRAVVALESTVISHGLPFPKNLETALSMEAEVEKAGAVPATIAFLNGKPTVGLTHDQIKHLASAKNVRKVSIRDIPIVSAAKTDGATTVAGTMFVAHRAGIKVFATGGIGGVHRGALADISADLPVLAGIPMTIVCAGAKIVLDLPATREWLETNGIIVLGWQTDDFPAFYSRKSGLAVDERVETVEDICAIVKARDEAGLKNAVLVAAPVPVEFEIEIDKVEMMLADAIEESRVQKIEGKDLTPFLLSGLAAQSEGQTIESNIALLLNNAHIAAQIAMGLAACRT